MRGIIGIDEVWRWPWAGPVVAWAVFFRTSDKPKLKILEELDDSKNLTKIKRSKLSKDIRTLEKKWLCICWIWVIGNEIIDEVGIRNANKQAMQLALDEVKSKISDLKSVRIKIDWRDNYEFDRNDLPVKYIIKWDSKIDEIKAASIIAKVTRDKIMEDYAKIHPWYHFETNVWYWTQKHQKALKALWTCPLHRKSYLPIKNALILEEKAIQSSL
ncbi:MAG: hypothetical protein ACD_2C00050G0011 [uncultured bacterium (gcode 4)]|uniref:Ribonuclease n=1 Tax=uncultured bacterium (gcode 4) TaxID=1234023 RepID=K2FFZ1_9BACT|nr:MAG: hypothetical protein ACD_2C00050G0011 [uncultured bacterium (gcode 4)]